MDDRVLVYRGADQPDMSVINPESDVWQHIKASSIPRRPVDGGVTQALLLGAAKISCNELAATLLSD